jgi:PAS domain S-box-containing protein
MNTRTSKPGIRSSTHLKPDYEYILTDYVEDSFTIIDTDLKIVNSSMHFRQQYKRFYKKEVKHGRPILTQLPAGIRESIRGLYMRVLNGEIVETEMDIPIADGRTLTCTNKYKPIFNKRKQIVGIFASVFNFSSIRTPEAEIISQENKYKLIVENSLEAFILSTPDGDVLDANNAAVDIFGYRKEELKTLSRKHIVDYTDERYNTYLRGREKEGKMKGEVIGIRKNGERFPLEISSVAYADIDGKTTIGTFARDISARKKAEQQVEKSEKRFKALIEKGEDIIILTNQKGIITYISPAFEKLTGYQLHEVTGKQNLLLMHEEQARETQGIFEQLLENPGMSIRRQNRLKCKDGQYKWVEGYISNLLNDESVQAIVSNYLDITERKKSMELVRESESNLKTIFDNTSEGFLLLDENGIIKAFNTNALQYDLLNAENKIKTGEQVLNVVLNERKEIFKTMLTKAAAGETIQYDHLYTQDNNHKWVDFLVRPVLEENQLRGFCVTGKDITARKLAEQEVAKRELRFRSILENSHDILFLFNAEGEIEFLSPAIQKLFGYTNGSNEIPNILDNIQADDLENVMASLKQSFSSPNKPVYITLRKRRKDGVYIWLEGTLTNMLHTPEVNAIVANFRDITERKLFEEQQEFLVSIINTSDDAILSIDTDKTILSWNQGAEKMFGYTEYEIIGQSIFMIIPPDRQHEEDEILSSIYNGVAVKHMETRRLTKNGVLIDVSLTVSLIKDNKGNVTGISKIIRDISDKKKAEEIISNKEKRFRSLLQNSNDGLSLLNIDGTILEISQTGKNIIGYDDSEMIGQARMDLIHPDDLELVSQAFVDIIEDPGKTRYFEYRTHCKDGQYKWLEASCSNLLHEPAVGAIVVNFRDITERKSQEIEREKLIAALNQNNDDLRNFSYITSHNLRAPLSNLMGFIYLLDDIPIEDPMLKAILDGFRTSTNQLNNTVDDLIKTLIIRDNNSVELKELSFTEIFTHVKTQLADLIHEARPEIVTRFNPAPNVVFKETYLENILMNLMTNAIKFRATNRKLSIVIETRKIDDTVVLTFADNGIGIDLERHKSKIFGLYQRFHERPNSKGLGLFLIKSQMESLGGSIQVDSVVDVGTTFTLRFDDRNRSDSYKNNE